MFDLGVLLEGVVERDPLKGTLHIVTPEVDRAKVNDVQDLLAKYEGKEVRLTLISFEELERLASLANRLENTSSYDVGGDKLPSVPLNLTKKRG